MNIENYKFTTQIIINDVEISQTAFIAYLEEKNFYEYNLPFRVLYINPSVEELNSFNNDEGNLQIKIAVYKVPAEPDSDDNPAIEELVFEDEFVGYMDDIDSPFSDEETELLMKDDNEDMNFKRRIFLTKEDDKYFGYGYNNIVSNEFYVEQIIIKAHKDCTSKEAQLFIEPIDNKIKYTKQKIFEPKGFKDTIRELDDKFTIYNGRPYIFIEGNVCYFMSSNPTPNYEIKKEMVTTVNVGDRSQSMSKVIVGVDSDTGDIYIPESNFTTYDGETKVDVEKIVYNSDGVGEKLGFDRELIFSVYEKMNKISSKEHLKNLFINNSVISPLPHDIFNVNFRGKTYQCKIRASKLYIMADTCFNEILLVHK